MQDNDRDFLLGRVVELCEAIDGKLTTHIAAFAAHVESDDQRLKPLETFKDRAITAAKVAAVGGGAAGTGFSLKSFFTFLIGS